MDGAALLPSQPDRTRAGDVPALLRRVADTLERLGSVEVQDLVLHNETTPEGDWPSLTVYFTADDVEEGSAERRA